MGNGAKANQRRERSDKKKGSTKGSNLKANAQHLQIQCKRCLMMFPGTSSSGMLGQHAEKHDMQVGDCFPDQNDS